jgi:hypothetical protein
MPGRKSRTQRSAVDTGRVRRPNAIVLDAKSVVPEAHLIKPPPNQFTHEVTRAQRYYYETAQGSSDGKYAAGTRVVLMFHDGGPTCRVVDARGLYVETAFKGLRPL